MPRRTGHQALHDRVDPGERSKQQHNRARRRDEIHECSLEEAGEEVGLCKQAAANLEKKALEKLRKALKALGIERDDVFD